EFFGFLVVTSFLSQRFSTWGTCTPWGYANRFLGFYLSKDTPFSYTYSRMHKTRRVAALNDNFTSGKQ
ncbi:unnamed protein product, partial [Heterotrigona itama]